MNARRIIALVLGVAAALSLLAKFGLLRAIGLDDFPFWRSGRSSPVWQAR